MAAGLPAACADAFIAGFAALVVVAAPSAGPAADPEHVRIGERVAQQHLGQGAGESEQTAAGESGERARQAQAAHHLGRHRVFRPEQRRENIAQRNMHTAHHQGQRQTRHGQCGKRGKDEQGTATGGHGAYFG